MKDVVILGFPKCGTTSLMPYLAKKRDISVARDAGFYNGETKPVVRRREWSYLPFEEQLKRFKYEFGDPKDYHLVFITRDPIERCWSGFEAWRHYIPFTYEEYLNITNPDDLKGLKYLGEVNPIKQVDYEHWIKPWRKYDIEVYKLEEIRKEPDFPHVNSLKKSNISKENYKLTKRLLEK